MTKKIILLFSILLLASTHVVGQTFTLTGRVTDDDGNAVEMASVACVKQLRSTITSLNGSFVLELQSADSVEIRFSMIGYKTKTRVLRRPRGKQTLQIVLHAMDTELGEVNVTGQRIQTGQTQEIKTDNLKNAPSATGNAVEEIIQTQAGVSTHDEMSSQYNVRGGAFDENSVYINNVEVYRPFLVRSGQQEGLSVINPDMVERIGFSTGGFEAKYGDKMSSALDIKYHRPEKFSANISASLLGASGYIGFGNKKFAWANSVRYKTTRYLLGGLETKGEYDPTFLDYQTYLSITPNKRWQIDFIGNISDNYYNFKPEDRETKFGTMENVKAFKVYFDGKEKDIFRTFFGSLSIKRNITDGTSISLIGSAFKTKEQERYDLQSQYWLTQTETSENLGVGTFFQHTRNKLDATVGSVKLMLNHKTRHHNVETALTMKHEHITERSIAYEMRDSAGYSVPHTGKDLNMIYSLRADNELNANRIESYIQDSWHFSTSNDSTLFTLNYGVRMSHWNFNRETIVSPRISLSVIPKFNQNMSMRVATGLYYQAPFYKELRDTTYTNGMTIATLNRDAKSQRSIHFIAGMDYRFKMNNRPFRFTAEAYYKLIGRMTPYSVNNVQVVYYGDCEAKGHAAGIDLKLFGEFVPGSDSWITLSWMNTQMKVGDITLPLPTDQRWGVNLFFTDYFPGTTRWKMALKLAYADGLPFSAPHNELTQKSFRAPAYKRVDIGMSYRLISNDDRHMKNAPRNVWLGVDGLNLLGINNVNSYYWITDVTNQQYAVPNYLTGRQINARITVEF